MNKVREHLNLITDIWNSIILENEYVQGKLKFNEKKRSNYFGEIIHYFNDTFQVIERHESVKTNGCQLYEYIFYNIGFLQTLYVHQDLTDEMLSIFSLNSSEYVERKQIRELRNELVGHPISKNPKTGELISSVFWLGNPPLSEKNKLDFSKIQYLKYESGKWDHTERICIEIDDLIQSHKKYLIKHFAKIIKKEKEVINALRKKLEIISKLFIAETIDVKRIIKLSKEYIFKESTHSVIMNLDYLEEALRKKNDGKRYSNYIDFCLAKIRENIDEMLDEIESKNKEIDKLITGGTSVRISSEANKKKYSVSDIMDSSAVIVNPDNTLTDNTKNDSNYQYYLSKLSEKKYLYLIDLLIQDHCEDTNLVFELNNMKVSYANNNNFEYYLSYTYVSRLLIKS